MASMVAWVSPVRTRSEEARAPRSSPTASTRMDLPAPVSPVRTLNPGSNSTSTPSMTARLRMRRNRSMWAELPSYHIFDRILVACYPRLSAPVPGRAADVSEASLRTLGSLFLLQVQGEETPFAGSGDVIRIVTETTPINQAVLLILVIFSIASWAIILQKFWTFRASDREDRKSTRLNS